MVNMYQHPLCNFADKINKEILGYQDNVNISPDKKYYKICNLQQFHKNSSNPRNIT